MLAHFRLILEPPTFRGDEPKSVQARIMNTLLLYFALALVIAAVVLVPLFAQHKFESWSVILVFLTLCFVARAIMFRGQLAFAGLLMIASAWVMFEVIAVFSGGIASPLMFGVVAATLVIGLILEPRVGDIFVIASLLVGLSIAVLQRHEIALPGFFVLSPLATWFVFALALLFMNGLTNLVVRNLRDALSLARRQGEALEQTERALRQSEERFQMFMQYFPGLAYMKDSDGRILFVNQGFKTFLGLDPNQMIGKTNLETFGPEFGEKLNQDDRRVLESGTGQVIEEEFAGKIWTTDKFSINQPGGHRILGGVTIDITERKHTERALRESEQRFRQLFEGHKAVMLLIEPDSGAIVDANPAAVRFYGYTRSALCGMSIDEINMFSPDQIRLERQKANNQERDYFIFPHRLASGEIRTVEVRSSPIDTGERRLLFSIVQDITERQRAEEDLQILKYSIDTAPDGAYWMDLQGRFLYVNDAGCAALGYSREELMQLRVFDVNPLVTPERWDAVWRQLREERHFVSQSVHRRKDGSEFPVEITSAYGKFGSKEYCNGFARDITERQRAEQALRASEEQYRRIVETAREGILAFDSDWRVSFANARIAEILQYDPGEMLGKPIGDFIFADDQSAHEQRKASQEQGVGGTYERAYRTKKGSPVWLLVSVAPMLEKGKFAGSFVMATDITERKHAEQELFRHSQELTTLYEIGQAFGKTLEPLEILEQTCQAVGAVLDNRNLYIALYDEEKQLISFPLYAMNGTRIEPSTRPFGKGLTEYVIQTKSPLFIPCELSAELEKRGIASIGTPSLCLVAVPMLVGDRVLGVIAVQDYEKPDAFDVRHQELLATIATQAAIALENAQLFKETKQRAEELATLNEIGKSVSARLEVESVLETIYQHLNRVLPMDTFYVALYDHDQNRISFPLLYDNGVRYRQAATPLAQETFTSRVIETGEPLLINRKPEEVARPRDPRLTIGDRSMRPASLLFSPLRQARRIVGVISVQSYAANAYADEHLSFLNGIASQVTIALENAQLFEHTEQNLQRMQALHEIDKAISSTHDLRATFDTFLTHLIAQLGVDAAAVLLLRESTQTLEYTAGRGFRTQALQHTHLRLGEGIAGRVALQRHIEIIPDLEKDKDGLARSPLLSEEGFSTYFGVPLIANGQITGVLELFHRHPVTPDKEWLAYLETLATQAAIATENMMLFSGLQQSNAELSLAYDTTLEGWSRALDLRDQETEGHTQRVTEMVVRLGRQLGIRENELVHLRRGSLLHDIGKMGIPDAILLKPGALSPEEWQTMRQHPVIAYRLLSPIAHLRFALDVPYCHHEKWDGTGYPRGLKGEEIPFVARLFAVVDVWDALSSDRPYRPAWPKERVFEYIQSESGKHFDPQVVDVFLKVISEGSS